MAQKTSKNAAMGCYQTRGEDLLHLIDNHGADIGGIDPTGVGYGALSGGNGFIPPLTKTVFVDGNRVDTYVQDGSLLKPFKTIMGAVNQIIANGDNSTSNLYVVYIAPKTYAETIVLEDPSLVYVVFHGLGAAVVSGGLRSQANNSNLVQADFRGLNFTGGGSVTLSGSGNFLSNGANFYDLYINVATWTQTGGGSQFFDTSFSSATTLTNSLAIFMGNRGPNTGTTLALVNSSLTVQRGSRSGASITVDATSLLTLGPGGRQDAAVTVNGSFTNRGYSTGAITVNTGGTYTEAGGFHSGVLTLNGGSYVQTGVLGASAVVIGGIKVSAGNVLPNGNVVGSPGDLYTSTLGGSLQTLWVKESGVATNTGWVGK